MDYTSIKVGQLPTEEISGSDFIPHEVNGLLKKATITDLAAFIGANDAVGFRAVSVPNGGTLPTTDTQEFILLGPGTYNNVGGGSTITVTEELNAIVSNGTYWFVGVEIPIDAPPGNAVWGEIVGTLSNQTDLQSLLNLKADLVAGKVPSSQLPSYVDDVVEVADFAALPASGETGKIYVTLDSGFIYRWTGTIYVRIADEAPTWGAIVGTLSDQTDLQSALNAKEDDIAAGTTAQYWRGDKSWQTLNKSAVGLGNVDNTSDADKPISTATQTALDGKFDDPTGDTTQYIAGDGSLITFPVAGQAGTLVRLVRNNSGATITKGTVVYINGASGNNPTIAKALATGDSTSAQTFGLVQADISNNSNGYVVVTGDLIGVNTSAITEGSQLYLSSTTAGAYTTTKQLAPAHLVYIGIVTRSHASLGQIEVKIQNGYELDELHDVAISSKTNKDFLVYESSTDLWKNKSLGTIVGGTSSQFIKGDGSLDSSVYLKGSLSANYIPRSLYPGSGDMTNSSIYDNTNGAIGIGVIPSDWDTVWKVLQISKGSYYASDYSNIMAHNLYVAGEDTKYISTNRASQYEQNSGSHYWYTAPVGTAGANMTLTPRMILDNSGNLGIGTISPGSLLHLNTSSSNGCSMLFESISTNGRKYGIGSNFATGNGEFAIYDYTAGAERMRITSGGSVVVNNLGTGLVYSNAGALTSTNPSDERLKDDITDLQYGLNEILQLRPVSYNWKNDNINQGKQFGFIAQEVKEVMPELVKEFTTIEDEEEVVRLGLDKEGIYAALVNAIKELKAEIELLKNK